MFSVTSESSAPSPARSEPPRLSNPDAPSQPNGFAALVDANAESSRPTTTDRRDPSQSSSRASRQDRDPPREAAQDTPNASTAPADSPRNTESAATDDSSHHETGKPSKQTKSEKGSSDSADANSGQIADVDATPASAPDVSVDPSTIIVVAVAAPSTAPAPAPAASPAASGSATAAPLSIAAAAIATSAQASAMPTPSGNATSPIVEAVAGAASEVNATNFTIAKAIATTPAPASEATGQADLAPSTAPQLASAVAAVASKVIKSSDKLVVTQATTTVDGTASDQETSQPPSPHATAPSATQYGPAPTNPHPQSNAGADATPASPPSPVDRSNGDSTTPSAGGHHTATVASQPQVPTPDVLSQLGATMTASQNPTNATIPVAQLTATAMTNLAVPVSGLAVQIAASARAGNSRFEIRLDPAELGRIDVRLDVDKHGQVSSHLTVEKPETLAMLRQDAPQLQRALEDAGLKTGQNGLQFSLRDQSSGQQNNNGQAERQPQRLVISETTAVAPSVAANITYSYAAGASRGLDIRV